MSIALLQKIGIKFESHLGGINKSAGHKGRQCVQRDMCPSESLNPEPVPPFGQSPVDGWTGDGRGLVLKEEMMTRPETGSRQEPVATAVVRAADGKEASQSQEGAALLQKNAAASYDVTDHGAIADGGRVDLVATTGHRVVVHSAS